MQIFKVYCFYQENAETKRLTRGYITFLFPDPTKIQLRSWNCLCVCVCSVTQLCPNLYNPMDCSLPGSSVHGIFQARILKWVAISYSRGYSRPRDWTRVSCISYTDRHPGGPELFIKNSIFSIYSTQIPFSVSGILSWKSTASSLHVTCLDSWILIYHL